MESVGQEDRIASVKRMDHVRMDFLWVVYTGMMRTTEITIVVVALFLMVVTVGTQEFTTAVEVMPILPIP